MYYSKERARMKTYHCGCGAWMGEGCDWSGPAYKMVVVEYTPEAMRETALAAGRLDTGMEFVAVCRDCWDHIQQQEAFDADWWAETTIDPTAYAEEADSDEDEDEE